MEAFHRIIKCTSRNPERVAYSITSSLQTHLAFLLFIGLRPMLKYVVPLGLKKMIDTHNDNLKHRHIVHMRVNNTPSLMVIKHIIIDLREQGLHVYPAKFSRTHHKYVVGGSVDARDISLQGLFVGQYNKILSSKRFLDKRWI